ncbi:MAG: HAMP domain-containing protein [Ignavibacteriae bacterium]|nr:HAMP domain-containing protein [Ignavibacteriota bacterium]
MAFRTGFSGMNRNLRIGTRLAIAFAVVTIVFASALVWMIRAQSGIIARTQDRASHGEVLMLQYSNLYAGGLQTGQATRNVILNPTDTKARANFETAATEIHTALGTVGKVLRTYEPDSSAKLVRIEKLLQLWQEDLALQQEAQQLAIGGKPADAVQLINKKETALWRDIKKQVFVLREGQQKAMQADLALMAAETDTQSRVMAVIGVSAVLFVILIGVIITRSITRPLAELRGVALQVSTGSVNVPAAVPYRDEVGELHASFEHVVDAIRQQSDIMEQLAGGTFTDQVTVRSGEDVLNQSIQRVQSSLKQLQEEALLLSHAAVEGKLATRGNAEKFRGGYREIVQGVNDTLDAVIGPLNVAAEYVDRISGGTSPRRSRERTTATSTRSRTT